jgi:hypothetical protein
VSFHIVKSKWGAEVWRHLFLTSALNKVKDQHHSPASVAREQKTPFIVTNRRGGVGPRAGLDGMEKSKSYFPCWYYKPGLCSLLPRLCTD